MSPKPKVAKNNNSKKKNVNLKNKISARKYFYAFLILIGGILLTLYIFEWVNVKNEEKLMNSYLISSNTINSSIKDFDSLNQVRQESPSSYFIYLSYTGDEKVYNFEKELKRVIDNYELNDNFYYLDITEIKNNNENYINEIQDKLNIKWLERVPAIIYVHEGKILESNILDGINGTMLKIEDLENLLDIYEFDLIK